jgi:diguanylate cyclase (GGDEF)-like protein
MMDIDHFKQYNDNYGHQMGDNVLKKLSEKIKNILKRSEDYCFRVGGEEFAIIFKIEEIEHAFLFANTIRKKIENLKIKHEYSTTSNFITVSMGLTSINALDIISPEELYKDTDVLLYKAKESGRNKVCSNYNPYL